MEVIQASKEMCEMFVIKIPSHKCPSKFNQKKLKIKGICCHGQKILSKLE